MRTPFFLVPGLAVFLLVVMPFATAQEEMEETPEDRVGLWRWDVTTDERVSSWKVDLDNPHVFAFKTDGFEMTVGGRLAQDYWWYRSSNVRDDTFRLSDFRVYLEAKIEDFILYLEPDIAGVDTPNNLWEAWGAVDFDPQFRLSAGQMKVALGTEYATRQEYSPFINYSFSSWMDGRYDLGVRANGNFWEGILWYEGTATTGHGFDLEGERLHSPEYALRLVWHPFFFHAPSSPGWENYWPGFFLGMSGALQSEYDDSFTVANVAGQKVMRTTDLDGDWTYKVHLDSGWAIDQVLLGGEAGWQWITNIPVAPGDTEDPDAITSWTLYAAWNITGEKYTWKDGGWGPAHIPGTHQKGWRRYYQNRWEIAARISGAHLPRDYFEYGKASKGASTTRADTIAFNLNWYPVQHTRLSAGWNWTRAGDRLAVFGDDKRDTTYMLRLELAF